MELGPILTFNDHEQLDYLATTAAVVYVARKLQLNLRCTYSTVS